MNKILLLALLGLVSICHISFGATDQPSVQQITCQCFVISSDHPIQHDFSKLKNYKGVRILSTPTVSLPIDREAIIRISSLVYPQYVDGRKEQKPIHVGISIALTGTLDQGKITLIGKMTSTEADAPKKSPEQTSLETVSSDLYFSVITKNGGEVWFDADRLFRQALTGPPISREERYHALRIIPALVPAKQ